jgi:LPXTG-site transpeptidase (sortase) family protein
MDPSIPHIVIPDLNLSAAIVEVPEKDGQWDVEGLGENIGWLPETPWFGDGGRVSLAGHITHPDATAGPFELLWTLGIGDRITVHTPYAEYTYSVWQKLIVPEDDLSVLEGDERSQLNLISCVGWDQQTRTYQERLIVTANLVETVSY